MVVGALHIGICMQYRIAGNFRMVLIFLLYYFIICSIPYTLNCEYFDVKIFSDSMACAKIERMKYMCNINDNVVQGSFVRKLFNAT